MIKFFKRIFNEKTAPELYLARENSENIIRLEKSLERMNKCLVESLARQTEALEGFCGTNEKFIGVMMKYFELEISAAEKANAEPRPVPTEHDSIF